MAAEKANERNDDAQNAQQWKQPLRSGSRLVLDLRAQSHAQEPSVRKGGGGIRDEITLKVVGGDEYGVADVHAIVHEAAPEAEHLSADVQGQREAARV